MSKTSKVNALLVFVILALGGIIYFIFSSDLFNMYVNIEDHKTKTLIGLLCATSYYLGMIVMIIIHKAFPNFK